MIERLVQYARKTHRCVNCGNVYTCSAPAVCSFAGETPDCPRCYRGPPYTGIPGRAP